MSISNVTSHLYGRDPATVRAGQRHAPRESSGFSPDIAPAGPAAGRSSASPVGRLTADFNAARQAMASGDTTGAQALLARLENDVQTFDLAALHGRGMHRGIAQRLSAAAELVASGHAAAAPTGDTGSAGEAAPASEAGTAIPSPAASSDTPSPEPSEAVPAPGIPADSALPTSAEATLPETTLPVQGSGSVPLPYGEAATADGSAPAVPEAAPAVTAETALVADGTTTQTSADVIALIGAVSEAYVEAVAQPVESLTGATTISAIS